MMRAARSYALSLARLNDATMALFNSLTKLFLPIVTALSYGRRQQLAVVHRGNDSQRYH